MTTDTKQALFELLEQEHGIIALDTEMEDIEHIVSKNDVVLMDRALAVLQKVCHIYDVNPNLIDDLTERLSEFGPV